MSHKKYGLLAVVVLALGALTLSACTQSLSSAPAKTPTVIPTGLFVSPVPSVENPMAKIEELAKQTAAAQTLAANGGTPLAPQAEGTMETPAAINLTPVPGDSLLITPTNALNANSGGTTPLAPNPTAVPSGARPASYTLQGGEFPYCIARRFNVDPDALISLSGLTSPDIYYPGLVLKIPQSGAFPGDRSLLSHPVTYTVFSADETLYSIACKYGDVDPAALASANNISISAKLSSGQQLQIP